MKKAQAEVRKVFNIKERIDETCINELKYLKSVVKETLRLQPPFPLVPRECRHEVYGPVTSDYQLCNIYSNY